jgi:hypothetical protein
MEALMACKLILAVAVAAMMLGAGCADMRVLGAGGGVTVGDRNTRVSVGFSMRDREIIRDYYARHRSKPLPPGLAKRDRLPPGLEKQLRKGGELPPGLRGRGLPRELERRLSPLPDGYARVVVGGRIVLQDADTRVVVDIIQDLLVD